MGSVAKEADNTAEALVDVLKSTVVSKQAAPVHAWRTGVEKFLTSAFPTWRKVWQEHSPEVLQDSLQSVLYRIRQRMEVASRLLTNISKDAKHRQTVDTASVETVAGHKISRVLQPDEFGEYRKTIKKVIEIAEPFELKTKGFDAIDVETVEVPGKERVVKVPVPVAVKEKTKLGWLIAAAVGIGVLWYYMRKR